jgi:hypothetical protein
MKKKNQPVYILIALLVLFFAINFQYIVNFTKNLAGLVYDDSNLASVTSNNIQKTSCQTSARRHNIISVAHHVGTPELFTDFADCPTKTAVRSGDWYSISTWGGSLPAANDVVLIPNGINVVLKDNVQVKTLGVAGSLSLNPSSDSKLEVSNFLTYPGSKLNIVPNINAVQTVAFTGNLNTITDPGQFGVGLVAIDSDINIVGRQTQNTNSRIVSASAGSTRIQVLDNISDWRVGQNVIFSDAVKVNNQYISNTEIKRIVAINGNFLTIDSSLSNTYKSSVVYAGQNIRFTSNASVPGHILFTGNTKLEFSGAYIEKMGRTRSALIKSVQLSADGELTAGANQIGRYSLHMHHLENPYHVASNVIFNDDLMLRWSATLHMSHGVFENNSIVNPGESAIAVETYLDTGTVKNNLVIGFGGGGEYEQKIQSYGYWSRSPFINALNNRVEGWVKAYSYYIDPSESESRTYKGRIFPNISSGPLSGRDVESVKEPGLFDGNSSTAYTGFAKDESWRRSGALSLWHFLGTYIKVSNFTATRGGILAYYSRDAYFDRIKLNETEKGSNSSLWGYVGIGISTAKFTNSEITGFKFGFVPGSISEYKNGVLDNEIDVVDVIGDQDCICHEDSIGGFVTLDSVKFSPTGKHIVVSPFFNRTSNFEQTESIQTLTRDIESYIGSDPVKFTRLLWPNNRVFVKNYNMEGKNFTVYPTYSSPNFRIPVVNLTNQELYDGRGTHPFVSGVYGRSLGDHIVKNPIYNPRIIGLAENTEPMKVIFDSLFLYPEQPSSSHSIVYYTNSSGVRMNQVTALVEYFGVQKTIRNLTAYAGLNKYQLNVNGNPYTILLVGSKNLPSPPNNYNPVIIDPSQISTGSTFIDSPRTEPAPVLPISDLPNTPPIILTPPPPPISNKIVPTCPFDSNVLIPGDRQALTVFAKTSGFATGGTGVYTVIPNSLTFSTQRSWLIPITIKDSAGSSVSVMCNFKVVKALSTIINTSGDENNTPYTINPNSTAKSIITSISPTSLKAGENIGIYGTGFDSIDKNRIFIRNNVGEINPSGAAVLPNRIVFKIPNIAPGTYTITLLGNAGDSNIVTFTILPSQTTNTAPVVQTQTQTNTDVNNTTYTIDPNSTAPAIITSISPTVVKTGEVIVLKGSGFDSIDKNRIFIRNNSGGEINPSSVAVQPTMIAFMVPNIAPGTYTLTLLGNAGDSNTVTFTVIQTNTSAIFDWFISFFAN